jgi:two-component system nitrogen regulation response regulator GlnG
MAPGQSVDVNDLPAELRGGAREQGHGGDITASINALATSDVTRRPASADWLSVLGQQVDQLLISAPGEVAELLTKQFESVLIRRALSATNGRRIEASQLLGLGRNTITRKIQELGLENSPIESQRDLAQFATTMSEIKSSA